MNATGIYNGLKSIATSVYSRFVRGRVVKVVETGIYSRPIVESDGSCLTPEERAQLLQEEADIDQNGLEEIRAIARRVLADHGIATAGGMPCFTTQKGGSSRNPDQLDDVPDVVRDASELLCRLNGLKGGIETRLAFQAGIFFERMRVRPFEPLAERGRTDVSARSKRRESIKKETSKKHARYLQKWRSLRADNPRKKTEHIDELTAKHFGVSERTIANARRQAGLS